MYDEELIERNLHPEFRGEVKDGQVFKLVNASCGDELEVSLKIQDGVVVDGAWTGRGCAISQVSSDIMLSRIVGKKVSEIKNLEWVDEPALSSVKRMPARVKCAELAWKVLRDAF